MVFKLQAAEGRWRAVNGPHLVALVRAGARLQAGKLVEQRTDDLRPTAAAAQGLIRRIEHSNRYVLTPEVYG